MSSRRSRRSRMQPSRNDRGGRGRAHASVVGAGGVAKDVAVPPPLAVGQVRCPVCRNVSRLTTTGRLYAHTDLFGNPCPNKATGQGVRLNELPPVILPPAPPAPREPAAPRQRAEKVSRLDVGSTCQECGKWLPGERKLCGRCYAVGEASRGR